MTWCYAKYSSKDQKSDFPNPAKANPLHSQLSNGSQALLSEEKKSVTATHKLMVTHSLLQIPNTEALKEILNLPYHVHLPALQGEKNKQLLKKLKTKKSSIIS